MESLSGFTQLKQNISRIISDNYLIKKLGNSHRIITKTPKNHLVAKKILVENNDKFFIYTLPSEKTISFILPGLISTCSAPEIIEELEA